MTFQNENCWRGLWPTSSPRRRTLSNSWALSHQRAGRPEQSETIGFAEVDVNRLPLWLGRFTKLRHLDLSGTYIKVAQLVSLRNMTVMEHLAL